MDRTEVAVVIPTTAEAERAPLLGRAIASVLSQADVTPKLRVVVNGDRFDARLLDALRSDPRHATLQLPEGHVSRARHAGVRASAEPFFGFLDDDDELLPGALRQRVDALLARPWADVVTTNGLRRIVADEPLVPAAVAARIADDPRGSFLTSNWFASPASLFRRSSFDDAFFDIPLRYYEWTWLFFQLSLARKAIAFVDVVTYRKHEKSVHSVVCSPAYQQAYADFLERLLDLPLDHDTKRALRTRFVNELRRRVHRRAGERDWLGAARCLARWAATSAVSWVAPVSWQFPARSSERGTPPGVGRGETAIPRHGRHRAKGSSTGAPSLSRRPVRDVD